MRLQRHSTGQRIGITPYDLSGTGGEAHIYVVPPDRKLAAKIYHHPNAQQRRKLGIMLANPPEDPSEQRDHTSIAWPIDLLTMAHGNQEFAGYVMPRVSNVRALFHVYNPSVRRQDSQPIDYLFLHRAARNLAASVRMLHSRGYVIGDVNESNVLVGRDARVTLVDTDSFQVIDPVTCEVFRCRVGKPEYTPPELQGRPYAELDRTQEHDRFGLAVLIFQLLMEGMHPFAGQYDGVGDPPPYETRIANGHFCYGNRPSPYRPGPIAAPFELLDKSIRQLFLRCFEDGHIHPAARPDAATWQNALSAAERSLITCEKSPKHRYGSHLSECPWCARTLLLAGRDPFPTVAAPPYERPARRARASQNAWRSPATGSSNPGTPTANSPISWQHSSTVSYSVQAGAAFATPSPTLFSLRMAGTGWAWGALFWALLALASAPLGLTGMMWLTAMLSAACCLQAFRSGSPAVARATGVFCAVLACTSASVSQLSRSTPTGVGNLPAAAGAIRSLSFSPGGTRLASGTARREDANLIEGEVGIWDIASSRLLCTPERASGDVVSVAYAPDGRHVVAATDSPLRTGEVVLVDASVNGAYSSIYKSRSPITQVAWSPDGQFFASAGTDRSVRIWSATTLQNEVSLDLPGAASAIAISPTGDLIAVGCESPSGSVVAGSLTVWEMPSGRRLWSKPTHGNGVQTTVFDPSGALLASGGRDGAICLWNPRSGRLVHRIAAHSDGIAAITFLADGRTLASAEERRTDTGTLHEVVIRDAASDNIVRTLSANSTPIAALSYSQASGSLAGGGRDGTIRIWSVPSNQFRSHSSEPRNLSPAATITTKVRLSSSP